MTKTQAGGIVTVMMAFFMGFGVVTHADDFAICAACHGKDGKGGAVSKIDLTTKTKEECVKAVTNGIPPKMPKGNPKACDVAPLKKEVL